MKRKGIADSRSEKTFQTKDWRLRFN